MSTHSQQQQQQQILQTCQRINQALQIDQQQFSLQSLTHLDWYMTVLQIIYPQLEKQFGKIRMLPDQGKAFDKLLVMLAKEEIIQQDFLEIKGQDIIEGDIESVYYVVQLLSALIQREGEEGEGEGQGEEQQQQSQEQLQQDHSGSVEEKHQQQQVHSQVGTHKNDDEQQQEQQHYQQSFEPQQQRLHKQNSGSSPKKIYPSQAPKQHPQNPQPSQPQFKNPFTQFDSHSQTSPQQQCHSVLGIHNQFQDEQQQDENQMQEDDDFNQQKGIKRPIGGGMSDSYPYKNGKGLLSNVANININKQQQQQQQLQQKSATKESPSNNNNNNNKNVIYQNYNQQQQHSKQQSSNQLISTKANYQQFADKQYQYQQQQHQHHKQFSSSSSSSSQDQHHQYTQLDQYHHQQQQLQHKYSNNTKPQQKQQQQQINHNNHDDQSQQEDQNEYFINPTIKKYKSQEKKIKHLQSPNKKTINKKLQYQQSPSSVKRIIEANHMKSPKKLVTHPTVKKVYRKAANQQAKKLTNEVKGHLTTTLKKKKPKAKVQTVGGQNVASEEMSRKKKQLKVKLTDYKQQTQVRNQQTLQSHTQQARANMQLGKILNWRQGQLKQQKQQFQRAMQMKVQIQKQTYIKKINKLLIKLQKQKQFHEQQTYKQKLFKQNQQAAKRLTAIQQWYKDRIQMLKQKNTNNKNERTLLHTGHKEILKHIEKNLKRDNQKQIMAMTMKYRKQQAEIQNDLEQLQREIIKVYKRN